MVDEPDNLVLVCLRRMDARLEWVEHKADEIITRTGFLERKVAGIGVEIAHISVRMDHLDSRLDKFERRIDIVPA